MAQPATLLTPVPSSLSQHLSTRLQKSWLQRDWLSWALLDASWLYGGLVALRRWLYARGWLASHRMPVPVIVVGNVVAGGAGKTPVVIEIVRYLQARGWQPGVVSRGYGRTASTGGANSRSANDNGNHSHNYSDCIAVTADTPASLCGDEPALIFRATGAPVVVARARARAARALLAAHPQVNVILCDDGLQHLALQRDIEVCVFDARGVGNGWLLPAGPLREPWPRTQPRAVDFVLHTGELPAPTLPMKPSMHASTTAPTIAPTTPATQTFAIHRQLAPYALRADGTRVPLASLQNQALHALAAIAQPEAFFTMLRAQGLQLAHTEVLPDHYNFNSWLRSKYVDYQLICTEKDAVKLWKTYPDALAVPLKLGIPQAFFNSLEKQLHSWATAD
jgi:tetraacyldisaccharide 4'-kinase